MTTDPKETPAPDPDDTTAEAATPNPEPEEASAAPEEEAAPDTPEPSSDEPARDKPPSEEPASSQPETDEPAEDGGEFAEMLDAATNAEPAAANPGDKVTGKIVQIDGPDAFVDCGLRNELPIAVADLKDGPDAPDPQVGDEVTAYVQKSEDGLKLAKAV